MKPLVYGIIVTLLLLVAYLFLHEKKSSGTIMQDTSSGVFGGGIYADYTGPASIPTKGDTILFFHADRCPTCNQAQAAFEKGLPEGITVLKVNYDEEETLKQQYAILTQTSYVYIQPDGTLIKRRVGGTTVEDLLEQLADAKTGELKPREKIAQKQGSTERKKAYFAGGCFWCLDGPFDSMEGVEEAIVGYIGGAADAANYKQVASGITKHREAVEVTYDPALVTYEELLTTYFRQIDPTDPGGQFADRGYQYTTAIYWSTQEEKQLATEAIAMLDASDRFDDPIAVELVSFPTFYPAEDDHQNYYLKRSNQYERYKEGSGRGGYIKKSAEGINDALDGFIQDATTRTKEQDLSHLTELQRRVTQEKGTERPFDNEYRDEKRSGIYVDIIDGTPLFSSVDKFDSNTGWPSFTKPISLEKVDDEVDASHGMLRTEITSSSSDAHLGHVFNDGPNGGERYCINSAALKFIPLEEMKEKGYSDWLVLFEE